MLIRLSKGSFARTTTAVVVGLAICVFSGAFFEQFIFGAARGDDITRSQRTANALLYLPFHAWFLLAAVANLSTVLRCLKGTTFQFFLLLLGLAASLLPFSHVPSESLRETVTLGLTFTTAIGVVAVVRLEQFLRILAWTLFAMTIASVFYLVCLPSWGWYTNEFSGISGTPQGVFRHKNVLAEMMSVATIVALTSGNSIVGRHVRVPMMVTSFCILLLTLSTNKIVGFAVGVIAWFVFKMAHRRGIHASLPLMLIGAVGSLGILVIVVFGELLLPAVGEDVTLTGRTYIWQHSWQHIQDRPLTGFGAASIWGTELGRVPEMPYFRPNHAHSTFVEVTLRFGIAGALICMLLTLKLLLDLALAVDRDNPAFGPSMAIFTSLLSRAPFEFTLFNGNGFSFLLTLILAGYIYRDPSVSVTQRHRLAELDRID